MKLMYLLAGGSIAAFVASVPAYAQTVTDTAQPVEETRAPGDEEGLTPIVVTAQKRPENLQDVPISVIAVGGDDLKARGIVNTAELGTVIPGLNLRVTNNAFLPYIRGIGSNAGFSESPTSLYIDGVYVAQSRGALRDLNDIAQVAVLKGPQGTLFGRNSTAGVIQITTRRPTQDFRAEGGVSLDNYETLRSDAYLSGGLAEGISASLSAAYATQGQGWGQNLVTGEDTHRLDFRYSVRGKLLFEPGPDTDITLIGEHFDERSEGSTRGPYPGTTFSYPGFGPRSSVYDSYSDVNGFYINRGYAGSLTVDQGLGFANLLSISSYRRQYGSGLFDNDATPAAGFRAENISTPTETYTQELQLSSAAGSDLKWVVGGFYFHNKDEVDPSILTTRPPFSPALNFIRRDSKQITESIAGFAQGTWEFLPETNLTLGARYTWEKRDFAGVQTSTPTFPTGPGVLRFASQTIKKPTFRVALDHQLGPDVLAYASVNTGFKSGGYNLLAPNAPPYQPETLTAFEAGLKLELFDRRVRLNGALFFNDYSNIQVSQIINNVSTISNAAKAETYGLDLDFQALVTDELKISGGAALLSAKYTQYTNAQIATPLAVGGGTITSGVASGNRLPAAQEFNANLALDYITSVGEHGLHFNVTGAYQGDYFFEPDNFIRQPAYLTLNTSLKLTLPDDRFSIMVWGKNLLDEEVITFGSATRTSFLVVYDFAPRTYGATLRYSF